MLTNNSPIKSSTNFLVLVNCMTYNHSKYINDALNGFSIQQTSFPYICLVMDDASTDGEQSILKSYMNQECEMRDSEHYEDENTILIIAHHKTNANCYFAFYFLKENLFKEQDKKDYYINEWRSGVEYEAMCEGDDYWIDPSKLQKQIDFLNCNPTYSMCFHNALEHWEGVERPDANFSEISDQDYSGPEIYRFWTIPTASVVFRKGITETSLYKKLINNKNFCFWDILLFISCAEAGHIRGFSFTASVYRRTTTGATSSTTISSIFIHNYEIYQSLGGDYKEPARQICFSLARKIIWSPGNFGISRLHTIIICLLMNPFKAIKLFFPPLQISHK